MDLMQTYDQIVHFENVGQPYVLKNHIFVSKMDLLFCDDILRALVNSERVPVFVGSFIVNQCLSYLYVARDRGDVLREMAPILLALVRKKPAIRMVIQHDRIYQAQIFAALIAQDPYYLFQSPLGDGSKYHNVFHRVLSRAESAGELSRIQTVIAFHQQYNLSLVERE